MPWCEGSSRMRTSTPTARMGSKCPARIFPALTLRSACIANDDKGPPPPSASPCAQVATSSTLAVMVQRYGPGMYEPSAQVSLPAPQPFAWAGLLAVLSERRMQQLLLGFFARQLPALLLSHAWWARHQHPAGDVDAAAATAAAAAAATTAATSKHAAGGSQAPAPEAGQLPAATTPSSSALAAVADEACDAGFGGTSNDKAASAAGGGPAAAAACCGLPSPSVALRSPAAPSPAGPTSALQQRSQRFRLANMHPETMAIKPGGCGRQPACLHSRSRQCGRANHVLLSACVCVLHPTP